MTLTVSKPGETHFIQHSPKIGSLCGLIPSRVNVLSTAYFRFILDDGSGEGQLYATNDMVRQTMGLSQREWAELNEILLKIGHLVYAKGHQEQAQVKALFPNYITWDA